MSDALQNINLDQLTRSALGGADTSWVKPTIDKLQKTEADKEAAGEPIREQTAKDAKADKAIVDRRYAGIEPVDIPKWDAEKEAAKVRTDPLQAFGSAASIFAIAASAFTHTPITNALNGSAAAMQAIKKGDEEGYNRNYDAWKENTKIALERHNAQHEDYQDAIEKMKTDMATGAAMLTAATAKYGDRATALMNEAGLYEKLGSLQESRANAAHSMLLALPDLERKNLEVQSTFALTGAQKKLDEAVKEGDPAKVIQAQLGLQQAQQMIKNVHEGLNPYATGVNAGKGYMSDLQLKAINEGNDKFAAENGRPPNASEQLKIANDIMASSKATGSSFDAQLLSDFRRDYASANGGKQPTAAEEAKFRTESKNAEPTYSPRALDDMAEQYLAGDKSVFQNLGRGVQGAANIVALREKISSLMQEKGISAEDQAMRMAEFGGLAAAERKLGTTQATIAIGRAELEPLIPQALAASAALPRSEYPSANSVLQAYERGSGDPRVRRLAIALQAVKGAYTQVLTRGGQSTDAARATADELFATKDSEEVIKAAMEQVQREAAAVGQAPATVRKDLRNTFYGGGDQQPTGQGGGTKDFSHLWGGQ